MPDSRASHVEDDRQGGSTWCPVGKGSISQPSCDRPANGFRPSGSYVVDQNGNQVSELDGQGNWRHTNVFLGGQLLATYDPNGLHFPITDALGTKRVQASGTGQAELNCANLPFGDGEPCASLGAGTEATEHRFTGKERDAESGLDHFKFRNYASNMGRWMSPDPSGLTHADLGNPQSLNLYNYVGNNPLSRTDLDGLCWKGFQWACNAGQAIDNGFHGLGFHTDATVDKNLHNANQFLNRRGISTEGMKGAAVLGLYRKTYQTYIRRSLNGGPDYSGRTSGTGTPEQNIAKRNSYQPKTGEYGPAELDKSSTNPGAIRGREQMNIEASGGSAVSRRHVRQCDQWNW